MVLIKDFAKLDRQAKWAGIRAYIYAETGGDPAQAIEVTATLLPELGLNYAEFEPSFNYLDTQERSILSGAGMRASITDLGIEKVEEDVIAWMRGGRQSTPLAPIFEKAYAVTREFEWQRFRFLLAMHELSGGQPGAYIFAERLDEELGEADVSMETVSHLGRRKMINPLSGTVYCLTDAGCVGIERMVGCLHRLGKSEYLDEAEFHAILPELWGLLDQPTPVAGAEDVIHSPDYTSVTLRGQTFTLTPRQGKVIRMLDAARRAGAPDVPKARIMKLFGYDESAPLWDVFKPRHRDAYRALIKSTGRGIYRLNL